MSHARFLCQCFDEKGPRLFDFPGRQWQQQYDAVCFMVLVCLQGGALQ